MFLKTSKMNCSEFTKKGTQCSREGIYSGCCNQHSSIKISQNTENVKLIDVVKSDDGKHKYTAIFDIDGKIRKVPFGASGYRDFTLFKGNSEDIIEEAEWTREKYRNRHIKDLKSQDPTKPGFLSYYILWGDSRDVNKNIREYKRMFNL